LTGRSTGYAEARAFCGNHQLPSAGQALKIQTCVEWAINGRFQLSELGGRYETFTPGELVVARISARRFLQLEAPTNDLLMALRRLAVPRNADLSFSRASASQSAPMLEVRPVSLSK
jgi:hypothetical protein